jgi:hypothetical protein
MTQSDRVDRLERRRTLRLLSGGAFASTLSLLFKPSPAQAKTSKVEAAYRSSPNGRQRCANCSWFASPSGCGVVKGAVGANGWCNLWG